MLSTLRASDFPRPSPIWALGLLAGFCVLSAGSAPLPPEDEWDGSTDFPLEVGDGADAFISYDDVGIIPLERGFQGGQHIPIRGRTHFVEEQDGDVYCSARLFQDASGSEDAQIEWTRNTCEIISWSEVGTWFDAESFGEESLLVVAPELRIDDVEPLIGQELHLRVQVELPDGQVGRQSMTLPFGWLEECQYTEQGEELPTSNGLRCTF